MRAVFLDDAQKLYAKRLNAAFLILCLIVLAWAALSVTLWIGKDLGRQEALAQMSAPKPPAEIVKSVDVLAGNCVEYARACFARKRMERVRAGS